MVVNATGEVRPKVAMATAKANSKLLPAAVNESTAVWAASKVGKLIQFKSLYRPLSSTLLQAEGSNRRAQRQWFVLCAAPIQAVRPPIGNTPIGLGVGH